MVQLLGSSICTIKMTRFCPPFLLIFAFFLLFISTTSCQSLLSLNCTVSSSGTLLRDQRITFLLENLIVRLKNTHFVSFANDQFNGVMQCRVGLSQSKCSLCAQYANYTISTLCPNSYAVTAWLDGCYVQYNHNQFNFSDQFIATRSCMNKTGVANSIHYEPALENLLLRLRAEANLETHHGFSYGELNYGVNSIIYGLIECARSLSPKECELCIGQAIYRLNESCEDKEGGIIVQRLCLVRFGRYNFYSESGGSGGGPASVSVWQSAKGGGGGGVNWKQNLVWLLSGCIIFLLVIIFVTLFVKRLVLNRAQVAMVDEEIESKVSVPWFS